MYRLTYLNPYRYARITLSLFICVYDHIKLRFYSTIISFKEAILGKYTISIYINNPILKINNQMNFTINNKSYLLFREQSYLIIYYRALPEKSIKYLKGEATTQ